MAASGAPRAGGAWMDVLVKIAKSSDAELNANANIVCFSDDFLVLEDAFPKAKTHWLVVPRDPALVGPQALDGLPGNTALLRTMRALATHALLHHAPASARASPHFAAALAHGSAVSEVPSYAAEAAPFVAPAHTSAPPAAPAASPPALPALPTVSEAVLAATASLPLSRCTVPAASEWGELSDSADDDCTVVASTTVATATASAITPARSHVLSYDAGASAAPRLAKFVPRATFAPHADTPSALLDPALPQPDAVASSASALTRPSTRFRMGFHAIPSLRPLHLHVISRDLASERLKNKAHYHSFASPFFVPIDDVIADIEARNAASISRTDGTQLWRLPLALAASGRAKTRRYAGVPAAAASAAVVDESGRAAAAAAVAALERLCTGPLVLFTDARGGGGVTSAGTSEQFLTDAALLALADGTGPVLGAGSGVRIAANMPALKRLLDERERG